MRKWGVVITAFYLVVLMYLIVPGAILLFMNEPGPGELWDAMEGFFGFEGGSWIVWSWIAILVLGEGLLLFLSVDTSWKRFQPRQHIAWTSVVIAFFVATLTFAAIWSLILGFSADDAFDYKIWNTRVKVIGWLIGFWVVWTVLFYFHYRSFPKKISGAVSWLLKGSVLELLIAVPAHVVVRQRGDCSAPVVTGFGIATGIAVMLMSFGPSVLFLYKKKFEEYKKKEE